MVGIGKLIKKVIGDDKAKKRELAMTIAAEGTKTTEKALLRLSEVMKFGERLDFYEDRLRAALGVEDRLFDDAVQDTREHLLFVKKQAEVKEELFRLHDFCPHLFMVGENKVPSSITMFGLSGGNRHRMICLDEEDFQTLSIKEQLAFIRSFIKTHQEEKRGLVPFFGKAVAYLYRPTPSGKGLQFNPQGEIVENDPKNMSYYGNAIVRIS